MIRSATQALCLAAFAAPAVAGDAFTPEQLRQLASILTQHESCVRQQVKSESDSARDDKRPSPCAAAAIAAVDGSGSGTAPAARAGQSAAAATRAGVTRIQDATTASGSFFDGTGHAMADRASGQSEPKFEISSTTDSSKVSVNVSSTVSATLHGGPGKDPSATFSTFSASLSAPVSKTGANTTNIATLDGFANSSTLTLGYHRFYVSSLRRPGSDELAECERLGIDIDKDQCDSEAITQRLKQGDVPLSPNVAAFFFDHDAFKLNYGATLTVGHDAYDFYDTKTLATQSATKTPWGVDGYIGFIPRASNSFLSAGVEFERAYTAAKSKIECPAATGVSPLQCVSGSFGAPTKSDKHLVYVEDRADFGLAAIDLRVTHDFASGDNGVDLPVYLFKDPKSTWTGGVRVGWTNTDHFDVGLFVGSSFGVFKD